MSEINQPIIERLYKELATADSFQSIYQAVENALRSGEEPIEFINERRINKRDIKKKV
jgi:hypothetical protein